MKYFLKYFLIYLAIQLALMGFVFGVWGISVSPHFPDGYKLMADGVLFLLASISWACIAGALRD